ncbi:MAG: 23S rRNA (cytidine1920-2'-O)/16S rRNA (cytidine1409-2'-O)-methyltransferase [Bacteriovoracaceae bacterium]|jgi:23S rRNA (cytidine1920-2'-O)/16S rRNA (cytidine1409-2'-O)-methyltransferase
MKKERVDKMLVQLGLVQTRSKAVQAIERGEVYYQKKLVTKTSMPVGNEGLEVRTQFEYVGRGAYKLIEARESFELNFEGKTIADIGASTGGFTQVALLGGAKKVFAIDVGHDQLDPILINDERVVNLERTNIRTLETLGELVDMVVTDLSFISIETVFEDILKHLKEDGEGVLLVKPQFELEKSDLGKKGIVRETEKQMMALEKIYNVVNPQKACISPIKGKEGNIEFLFYFIKNKKEAGFKIEELKKLISE